MFWRKKKPAAPTAFNHAPTPSAAAVLVEASPTLSDRDIGDAARDRLDWSQAIEHYSRHLDAYPDDFAIWIQRGHAEKEAGNMAAAEICYLSATALAPDDADLQLQMGHLYKLQRRYADAASHYRRAAELSPYLVDAHRELADVNILAEAESAAGTSAHADGGDDEVWDYQEPVPHATITIEEADWESDERLAERAAEATGKELNGAAAVLLRARVARAPTDRARWYELAAALDVMGDAQQAARCRAIAASLAA